MAGGRAVMSGNHITASAVVHHLAIVEGSTIESGVYVGPFSVIRESHIGAHTRIDGARIEESSIAEYCEIGRAEIKRCEIKSRVKAKHWCYLGDAHIGKGVNIGAGAVICNYDGKQKHATEIGAGAFIGVGVHLIAPLFIGERAVIGAGAVIPATRDVPDDTLVISKFYEEVRKRLT